ncbi:MAG: hypothetical protein IPH28_21050 [Cytophagaceae bacterium]|nr:hypothetical protein [Cytophagaceae bacterium]
MEIRNYRYTSYTPKDNWTQTGGTAETFNMSYNNGSIDKYSDERNSQNTQLTLNLSKKMGDLDMRGKLSYLYENRDYEWYDVNASQLVVKMSLQWITSKLLMMPILEMKPKELRIILQSLE